MMVENSLLYMIIQVDPNHPNKQSQNIKLLKCSEDYVKKIVYNMNRNEWDNFEYYYQSWEVEIVC